MRTIWQQLARTAFLLCALNLWGQGWKPAVNLGSSDPGKPALAMNSTGGALAVFGYNPQAGSGRLFSAGIGAGQDWGPAVLVPLSDVYDSALPAVALDATGAAALTFIARQVDNYDAAYIDGWRFAGGNWGNWDVMMSPVSALPARLGFYGTSPLAINTALALTPSSCNLWAWVSRSANWWSTETSVAADCVAAYDFAVNPAGYAVVAYWTTQGEMKAARRSGPPIDGDWSAATVLASGFTSRGQAAVAVSAANEATAVFTGGRPGTRTIQVWQAAMDASGNWTAPVLLSSTACSLSAPVAIAGTGDTVAAWVEGAGGRCRPVAAIKPAGGSFGPPATLATFGRPTAMAAAATAGGAFVVAWNDVVTASVLAATGSAAGFPTLARLGPSGIPALAAGGGWVSAVWCSANCYASSLALP